jgi:tetratricopeptide (TPR) repeat protein
MSLDARLGQLENAQLVRRADDPELAYLFKHTLTQETAYQSLLLKTRREIHRRVAEAIERLHAERLDDYAGILARHYAEAEDDAKTLEYAMRAGDVAARVYANVEALAHYSLALEVAKRTTHTRSPGMAEKGGEGVLRDIFVRRGRMLELSSRFDEALANYDEMEAVGQERGDRRLVLAALMARATIRAIPTPFFDSTLAKALSDEALLLARELGDQVAEAKILWNLMLLHSRTSTTRYREALAFGEQSLEIARRLNLREQLAFTLNDLSMLYIPLGQPERGKMVGQEARELWREMNNLPMLADNLGYSTANHLEMAEFEQAISLANEAKQLSQRIGNLWGETFSQTWVGRAYLELGQPAHAIEVMQEAVRLADISGFRAPLVITRADLGKLYGDLGAVERGLELTRLAFEKAQQSFPGLRSWSAGALAHVVLSKGDRTAAETIVRQGYDGLDPEALLPPFDAGILSADCELAMAHEDWTRALTLADKFIAGRRRVRHHLPEALYLKGLALRGQGELNGARATLAEARAEAEAQHARWSLWRILAALSEVEAEGGNQAEAQTLRSLSRAIVQEISQNIPEELRGGFLELPQVRAVLGK